MQKIRSTHTKPELEVRRLLHSRGYRYRLHVKNLPGKPDLVFPSRRKIIQVHGCFWHQHDACREGRVPGTRREYWGPKLARNVDRDRAHAAKLESLGWKSFIVWECELKSPGAVTKRLTRFLGKASRDAR